MSERLTIVGARRARAVIVVAELRARMADAEAQAAAAIVRGTPAAWVETAPGSAKSAQLLLDDAPIRREMLAQHEEHEPEECWVLRTYCRQYGVALQRR